MSRRTSDSQQLNNSSRLVSPLSTTRLGLTSVFETLQHLRVIFHFPPDFHFMRPLPSSSPSTSSTLPVFSLLRWSQPIIHLHPGLSSASLLPINFISNLHFCSAGLLAGSSNLQIPLLIHLLTLHHFQTMFQLYIDFFCIHSLAGVFFFCFFSTFTLPWHTKCWKLIYR